MEKNSDLIYNENISNQVLYKNYTNFDSKEKKFKSLSEKINELHNLKINNPNRSTSLEYNINKINSEIKNIISNYKEKSNYLEKTLQSLIALNESRKQIQDNNKKKYEKEYEIIIFEIQNKIDEHKNYMIERINNEFKKIENKLVQVIQNKKENNSQIFQQLEKLKTIANNEIPKICSESNNLNYKNKNNIEIMQTMLYEEVNYAKNVIIDNSQKIKENEDNFRKEINSQMKIFNKNLDDVKKSRKKYEEDILEHVSDFINKIKDSVK